MSPGSSKDPPVGTRCFAGVRNSNFWCPASLSDPNIILWVPAILSWGFVQRMGSESLYLLFPWRPAHSSPACSFEEFSPHVPPQHPLPFLSLFGEHVINISRQEDPFPSRNSFLPCKDRENIRHKNTNEMRATKRVNTNQWLLITYMANCVLKKIKRISKGKWRLDVHDTS